MAVQTTTSVSGQAKTRVSVRLLRHLAAGGFGTLGYTALVPLQVELLGLRPVAAVTVAFLIVFAYSYVVNRTWVHSPKRGNAHSFPRFIVVVAVSYLLNAGIMQLTVDFLDWSYLWGLFFAAWIVPPTNFVLNYYWAFD